MITPPEIHVDGATNDDATPAPPPRRRSRRLLTALAVVAALLVTGVVAYRWGAADPPETPVAAQPTPSPSGPPTLSVGEVYQTLAPSVVAITATGTTGSITGRRAGAPTSASGTGVVVNADGTILTALHVVEGADAIAVTFADGTRAAARIAGTDPAIDIASLTPAGLPELVVPAVLGASQGLSVGDEVVAIGNQLGLTGSTTSGVVSGLGRSVNREAAPAIEGLIQFDAAVNPGSSGGPLVSTTGETVGIVVALANPTQASTFIGVGFAVPIGAAAGATGSGDGRGPQI